MGAQYSTSHEWILSTTVQRVAAFAAACGSTPFMRWVYFYFLCSFVGPEATGHHHCTKSVPCHSLQLWEARPGAPPAHTFPVPYHVETISCVFFSSQPIPLASLIIPFHLGLQNTFVMIVGKYSARSRGRSLVVEAQS